MFAVLVVNYFQVDNFVSVANHLFSVPTNYRYCNHDWGEPERAPH